MKEYIQHRFYADGYSYIITFKNGDYIMKMYLGQYIDGLNICLLYTSPSPRDPE